MVNPLKSKSLISLQIILKTSFEIVSSANKLWNNGQNENAVSKLEYAIQNGLANRDVIIQLALFYLKQKEREKAYLILKETEKFYFNDPWIQNLLAKASWENGNHEIAVQSLQKACNAANKLMEDIKENLKLLNRSSNQLDVIGDYFQKRYHPENDSNKLAKLRSVSIPIKQLVFVSQRPRGREAKIAYGLRQAGLQVVLLYQEQPNYDLKQYFDKHYQFSDYIEALDLSTEYMGSIFHVFSLMVDPISLAFVKNKPGKIIFDPNDIFEGTINQAINRYEMQRYCIENAHALCCRDLQIQYVKNNFNYKTPKISIFFPEYCWDFHNRFPSKKSSTSNREIHVVSIGNFGIEKTGEDEWGYLDIARQFIRQEIHFHIYQHWFWLNASETKKNYYFEDYLNLAEKSDFFHIYPTVSMDRLSEEISQYDFGINVISSLLNDSPLKKYHPAHFRNCLSLRNIDYLDTGLPVIISPQLSFQHFMLRRIGALVDGTRDFFKESTSKLLPMMRPEISFHLTNKRLIYSLKNQIKRLIYFFNTVQEKVVWKYEKTI